MDKDTYDPHRTTTEVRSGDKRQMSLRVLVISSSAIIVAFALIYFFGYPFSTPQG